MVETNRLRLIPLTYDQLIKYGRVDYSLERELGLQEISRSISSDLLEPLEQTILMNVANPNKNYLYSTLWIMILKTENKIVGDLCFKGEPNSEGEIEIGYGTYENFRNEGYMTEAVSGIINWAVVQPGIKSIIAETEKSNLASFRILEKNNFKKYRETEFMFWWKLSLI